MESVEEGGLTMSIVAALTEKDEENTPFSGLAGTESRWPQAAKVNLAPPK
jgi:hypothetical protein